MAYKDIKRKRAYDRAYWRRVRGDGPPPISAQHNMMMSTVKDLRIKVPKDGLRIAFIPDAQVVQGVPIDHLEYAGRYIADKRPDVIVCIGDFGDFPSLSHFEQGTLAFEDTYYEKDIGAFLRAMDAFMNPIAKASGYKPYLEFTQGNHEDHIRRYVHEHPVHREQMSVGDLKLEEYGWRVHPFLRPISIGGVAFCHYFPSGPMGRPITTAPSLLRKLHMSALAGHQQGREIAYSRRADGANLTAIIAGSFYQHNLAYLSPFTNAHWRGMYFLHEVQDGRFDEMALSINFLKRRFGKK